MPLLDGDDEETIGHNIRELVAAGHSQEQAVAIALSHARDERRGDESFAGVPIVVETPAGATRRWISDDGESGETTMLCDYGHFAGTRGADGEEVDVILGPNRDADAAYVVHQMRPPDFTKYDEDKVMCGFSSADEAKRAYLDHYDDPRFFGAMTEIPANQLADRLERPGSLRADGATRARLWLSRTYRVDLADVPSAEVLRRTGRILGVFEIGEAALAAAVAVRLDELG